MCGIIAPPRRRPPECSCRLRSSSSTCGDGHVLAMGMRHRLLVGTRRRGQLGRRPLPPTIPPPRERLSADEHRQHHGRGVRAYLGPVTTSGELLGAARAHSSPRRQGQLAVCSRCPLVDGQASWRRGHWRHGRGRGGKLGAGAGAELGARRRRRVGGVRTCAHPRRGLRRSAVRLAGARRSAGPRWPWRGALRRVSGESSRRRGMGVSLADVSFARATPPDAWHAALLLFNRAPCEACGCYGGGGHWRVRS